MIFSISLISLFYVEQRQRAGYKQAMNIRTFRPGRVPRFFAVLTLALLLVPLIDAGQARAQRAETEPLTTVSSVDLRQYMGKWYQIAYFPTRFQKNCEQNVSATYTLLEDSSVRVENECFKNNGTRKSIKGVARVVNPETNAQLKVKFFWFAPAGDYWIIDLGQNYEYAVVSEPKRRFLWILARNPNLSRELYASLLSKIAAKGLDASRVKLTSELLP